MFLSCHVNKLLVVEMDKEIQLTCFGNMKMMKF